MIIATNSGGTTEALRVENQTEIKAYGKDDIHFYDIVWGIKYHRSTYLK